VLERVSSADQFAVSQFFCMHKQMKMAVFDKGALQSGMCMVKILRSIFLIAHIVFGVMIPFDKNVIGNQCLNDLLIFSLSACRLLTSFVAAFKEISSSAFENCVQSGVFLSTRGSFIILPKREWWEGEWWNEKCTQSTTNIRCCVHSQKITSWQRSNLFSQRSNLFSQHSSQL